MTDVTARRLVAGFVFVVLAISGARIAVAEMFPGLPDVYKFQEMPYPCQTDQDCPPSPLYHCVSNQCHLGPLPMFLNQGNWRPVALEVDSRRGGDVGLLLGHGKLKTYDLADPQFPLLLATEPVGLLARALALAGGVALVARMGPGSDLLLVDINEPAAPTATG